jgi:hypothetical protein
MKREQSQRQRYDPAKRNVSDAGNEATEEAKLRARRGRQPLVGSSAIRGGPHHNTHVVGVDQAASDQRPCILGRRACYGTARSWCLKRPKSSFRVASGNFGSRLHSSVTARGYAAK